MENRDGLIVSSRVWEAIGIAERYAALEMLQDVPGIGRGVRYREAEEEAYRRMFRLAEDHCSVA